MSATANYMLHPYTSHKEWIYFSWYSCYTAAALYIKCVINHLMVFIDEGYLLVNVTWQFYELS